MSLFPSRTRHDTEIQFVVSCTVSRNSFSVLIIHGPGFSAQDVNLLVKDWGWQKPSRHSFHVTVS